MFKSLMIQIKLIKSTCLRLEGFAQMISGYFNTNVRVVSFAAVFRVVMQRSCGEERYVTTLKTAAKEKLRLNILNGCRRKNLKYFAKATLTYQSK